MDKNSALVDEDLIKSKIDKIRRQTDYTVDKAREKLEECKYDEIMVIKGYFGIAEKKPEQIKSINQAIYKQLRGYLDNSMQNYHERVEKGEVNKIV
jgi:exonuclease III